MKRTINSTEKGKDVGISPAEETPIPGFPTDYEQRSGTRQDQLSCMLQVERRLLQYRQVALCCRYTRSQFLEEMQSLSGLFGLEVCSSLMREYQRKIPRKAVMSDFEA